MRSQDNGPPICLINGYRLSGFAWPRTFIARLAARCTVIALDNRGTGRSDKPAGRIRIRQSGE